MSALLGLTVFFLHKNGGAVMPAIVTKVYPGGLGVVDLTAFPSGLGRPPSQHQAVEMAKPGVWFGRWYAKVDFPPAPVEAVAPVIERHEEPPARGKLQYRMIAPWGETLHCEVSTVGLLQTEGQIDEAVNAYFTKIIAQGKGDEPYPVVTVG